MAFIFSYSRRRDPLRLMDEVGMKHIGGTFDEYDFLQRISRLPPKSLGCLCLVQGGFMDGISAKAYAILDELEKMWPQGVDMYYREHEEARQAAAVISIYGMAARPIFCIGHSWGGATLAREVLTSALCRNIRIEGLLTLDPVGVRGPVPLPNVKRWLNIYVPYSKAAWSRENNVARIGRPWERVPYASRNEIPSVLRHPDAPGMFRQFGADFMQECLRPFFG